MPKLIITRSEIQERKPGFLIGIDPQTGEFQFKRDGSTKWERFPTKKSYTGNCPCGVHPQNCEYHR